MKFSNKSILIVVNVIIILLANAAFSQSLLNSSQLTLGSDEVEFWQKLGAPGYPKTNYFAVEFEKELVLASSSDSGASGYWRDIRYDLNETPNLRWMWRVDVAPANSQAGEKEGDDFAARVFVGFDHQSKPSLLERTKAAFAKRTLGRMPPRRSLIYVWQQDAGTTAQFIQSPYNDRSVYIVLPQSPLATWQSVERNILEDYRMAFGEEPYVLEGIGIMTDTDNAKGKAKAFYGDVERF